MAVDSDYIVDRQRLKRSLFLWRVLAVVATVLLVAVGLGEFSGLRGGDYIARISVDGLILDDPDRRRAIRGLAQDSSARAVIVHVDSPGGTVVGGQTLYKALRDVAAKKPVVAVMGQLATSAGYMVSLAADHILAQEGTITGSIGVILQTTEFTGLMEKIGVSAEAIKSDPLKATPSPFERLTPEARKAAQTLVDDMHRMFVDMVAERRSLSPQHAREVSDGRVFTGRIAVSRKLIDGIGGEREAVAWLQKTGKIETGLPIRDLPVRKELGSWLQKLDALVGKVVLSERLTLDGLISVWQPAAR